MVSFSGYFKYVKHLSSLVFFFPLVLCFCYGMWGLILVKNAYIRKYGTRLKNHVDGNNLDHSFMGPTDLWTHLSFTFRILRLSVVTCCTHLFF